ncbi:ABC transporter permease [Streptomyces sp. MB09-01]|nr:ABC transporter permease [Streptomyces sp. MB09-01]MDX3537538.1 ABC transporter permease [Streptomyces sp. MB09-01]
MLLVTATRYALVEHARNRFAMVLIAAFLPVWTCLAYVAIPDSPAPIRLRATGELLAPQGNEITAISGALNAVTLITGFLMFAATFTSSGFDRRLAMAGYPRTHLVAAKVGALALASALISAYATVVACLTWTPNQPLLLAVAFFSAGLTYGVLGVGFGALLRREVEGMFAIVMTSIVDLLLQNPIMSSGAGSSITRFLPSYGAMQAATAAGFSHTATPSYVLGQLAWCTVAALLGLLAFHRRTRSTLPAPGPAPGRSTRQEAMAGH